MFLMTMGFLNAILNVVFNVGFGLWIGVAGIALSTSLTMGIIQFIKTWRLGTLEDGFPLGGAPCRQRPFPRREPDRRRIPIALIAWNLPHGLGLTTALALLVPRAAGMVGYIALGRLIGLEEPWQVARAMLLSPRPPPTWAPLSRARRRRPRSRPRAHDGRRPRVLRIITRLAVSGVSTHVTLANQGLTRRGWDTLLVHGRVQPDELEIDLPIPDVAMHRIDTLARPIDPIADLRTAASLLSVIRSFRPDIIHTHHSKAGLLGRSVGILAGVPRVHTFHGHVFEGYFGARTSAAIVSTERLLATRTSRLIALGPLQRDDLLARGIGRPDRFEIVPLGLDLDRYRGPTGSAPGATLACREMP